MNKGLVYNGKSFSDFGVRAICQDPFLIPEADVETTHISGMNGDLHFDYGSYQNVSVTYLCVISVDFRKRYAALRSWIRSMRGYKKLEDSVYPEEFRMAALSDISTKSSSKDPNGFDITFDCKPQRFLKSGENIVAVSTSGAVYNPTHYNALPLIRVYGTGALQVGNGTLTIVKNSDYTDIDCDLQEAYHGPDNRNGNIKLSSGEFPELLPGKNGIIPAAGMRVEIKPRWYTL